MIKGIPISSRLPANKLIWAAEAPNCKFSVKNAYGVATRVSKFAIHGASSHNSQLRLFWKKVIGPTSTIQNTPFCMASL